MAYNPPKDIQEFGQSAWLDYIHRKELENGGLQKRIDEDGIVGVTSNPSIFQKAIGESDIYDDAMVHLLELEPEEIYEHLAIEDIQAATDLFRPIYDKTNGKDGYVSLEVSPHLAHDTETTLSEARRLSEAVGRPNVMIKIPATNEGIPAIEEAIADGINVNVTLIFSVDNYIEVAKAYIRGLKRRHEAGQDVTKVASVASFFLSRIDVMIDRILENNIRAAQIHGDTARVAMNRQLLGQAAVANAKIAYQEFKNLFEGVDFEELRMAGAQVQRPLWASTSTKNPAYPDTKYVDNLIGKDTVNTLPPGTLKAFKDHGSVGDTIEQNINDHIEPSLVMEKLAEAGIDMDQVTKRLQVDGVDAFIDSFDTLIKQVAAKQTVLKTGLMARQRTAPGIYADALESAMSELESDLVNQRIWAKDGTVWKDWTVTVEKIKNRLGWLDVQETINLERLKLLQDEIRDSNISDVVLLGMGGSSLAPEVLMETFGKQAGFPELLVLDSTDPVRIQAVRDAIDLGNSLFIVASKSGGTVETLSFYKYFYEQTGQNGKQFIAITDDGSQLEQEAHDKQFRDVFVNPSDIGGRYSALSYFGLLPAALIGLDLNALKASTDNMIAACGTDIPDRFHPALHLGAFIGTLALQGRDKVSIYCSSSIATFGNWVEQLIAESLGKEGKGVTPVVGATIGNPHDYVTDRVFIYLRVDDDPNAEEMDEGMRMIRRAGHPLVTIYLPDRYAIAGEFFRWEYATALAGRMLNVNPFDEPNVTEAKEATKELLAVYQEEGSLPTLSPLVTENNVSLYAAEHTAEPLYDLCRAHGYSSESLVQMLAAQFVGTHAGDYFAFLNYFTPSEETISRMEDIRRTLRHTTKRAVTIGYGPRYLHSTGQLHKGGSNNGVFIQITVDPSTDIQIPDAPYSFQTLFSAQAAGDLETLNKHKRRALRLHISGNIASGLQIILDAIAFVNERRK